MPARVSTGENSAPWQGTHNVFVERLWRSVKYEEVYLRAYDSVGEARASLSRYFIFYNTKRPHSSLDARTPECFYYDHLPQTAAA